VGGIDALTVVGLGIGVRFLAGRVSAGRMVTRSLGNPYARQIRQEALETASVAFAAHAVDAAAGGVVAGVAGSALQGVAPTWRDYVPILASTRAWERMNTFCQ
jgi:hypothetical protein